AAILLAGCQTAGNSNNTNQANTSPSPLPPGISTSPLPPGATPTPGIPDVNAPKNANQPKGTPTPGIPDMSKPQNNANSPKLDERTTPSKGPIGVEQNRNRKP
ncbi:MAG: hypothetical protein JO360_15595, partial [Acidobacteria bacterium]|nr:hypothetical protein [Acidobacteriota bacterium]